VRFTCAWGGIHRPPGAFGNAIGCCTESFGKGFVSLHTEVVDGGGPPGCDPRTTTPSEESLWLDTLGWPRSGLGAKALRITSAWVRMAHGPGRGKGGEDVGGEGKGAGGGNEPQIQTSMCQTRVKGVAGPVREALWLDTFGWPWAGPGWELELCELHVLGFSGRSGGGKGCGGRGKGQWAGGGVEPNLSNVRHGPGRGGERMGGGGRSGCFAAPAGSWPRPGTRMYQGLRLCARTRVI
jgi:hypothetical protein